jgi:hypothetical protein
MLSTRQLVKNSTLPVSVRAFEQRVVDVLAMDHGIGIAEALAEVFVGRDLADLVLVDRVVHHHVVGEYGAIARLVADAEGVEGVEGIRAELDAGTDFTDLCRLFEDHDLEALAHQGECGGEAANAATGDEYGKLLAHLVSPLIQAGRWSA